MSKTRRTKRVVAPVVALSAALAASFAFAPSATTAVAQDGEMAMEKPGPEHKHLAALAGTWDQTIKFKMDPAGEWQESKNVETIKVVCGGFFVAAETNGQMMGAPFEGRNLMGYDNHKKKFTAMWIDSFGSYMTLMEGTYDEKTKTLTMTGDMLEPMSGKYMKVRMTTEDKSADEHVAKMYMPGPDGKEFVMMEITSKRRK